MTVTLRKETRGRRIYSAGRSQKGGTYEAGVGWPLNKPISPLIAMGAREMANQETIADTGGEKKENLLPLRAWRSGGEWSGAVSFDEGCRQVGGGKGRKKATLSTQNPSFG